MASKLGAFLKYKRLSAGLTQAQVSKKLGHRTPQFVSNWEQGIAAPPLEAARKLPSIYNMRAEEFYDLVMDDRVQRETDKLRKAFGKALKPKNRKNMKN